MSQRKLTVLLSEEKIQSRIREIAAQIDNDYASDNPLIMICVLKGAVLFYADLTRAVRRPVRMDFIGISSYGRGKTSSGEVKLTKDLDSPLEGFDVLIVEDILDSGVTLNYLAQQLEGRRPRSIKIVTLLDKPERRLREVHASYVGFQISDAFVVGYGLDFAEDYRTLRDICVLEDE